MKFTKYILISFLLLTISLYSQDGLVNTGSGKIRNSGKIIIKKNVNRNEAGGEIQNSANAEIIIESNASFSSDGNIDNEGLIEAFGQVTRIAQPSINGTVIYDSRFDQLRYIPQISYYNIHFRGEGRKFLDEESKILESRNYFYSTDGTPILWDADKVGIEIHAHKEAEHFGRINPAFHHGLFKLNGQEEQIISGTGKFSDLELDNESGVEVIDKTGTSPEGFLVSSKLILTKGIFNNANSNFRMGDSSTIIRNVGSELVSEAVFEGRMDLRYIGDGSMISGGELPSNESVLQRLIVNNTEGIYLNKDATVNDSIYLASNIITYETDANDEITQEHTLTFTNNNTPEYDNVSEIEGRFRRTNLDLNNPIYFNNEKTYALFRENTNPSDISEFTFDIKPRRRWSLNPRQGDSKIQRTYRFEAKNSVGDDLASAQLIDIQYAWKHDASDVDNIDKHETPPNLMDKIQDLVLQKWNESRIGWDDNLSSNVPQQEEEWLVAQAQLEEFGDYAVGLTVSDYLYLLAKVLLEGAYRGDLEMGTELVDRDLVSKTPPNIYPYNLDPNIGLYDVEEIPEGVVDWILLEFRKQPINPSIRHFRMAFLRKDGQIVDMDGTSPVQLSRLTTNDLDTTGTFYYLAIRHRSHLTIMSRDSLYFGPDENPSEYDFTNPILLYGGSAKPIDFNPNQRPVYGMIAGNYVEESLSPVDALAGQFGILEINEIDYSEAWAKFNMINQYMNFDFNMDGIVTTRDFNISWNNRFRATPIR